MVMLEKRENTGGNSNAKTLTSMLILFVLGYSQDLSHSRNRTLCQETIILLFHKAVLNYITHLSRWP